ncbi:MAG: T9SS type A sorting domain-containing protein [Flavobacteriaceae bacterium]|nr:T9SS type A sorting domain-containing protein [Flavobacteriaceae bacterium]
MKNHKITLIALFVSFFSFQSHAQYESIFGEESTRMQLLTIDNMPVFVNTSDAFSSSTTTVINNQTYHEFTWHTKQITGDWETLVPFYYLREDTESGKVWLLATEDFSDIPANSENELLVVDMSLEIGDEFEYHSDPVSSYENTVVVTVIDVFYEDDRKHIVFDLEYDPSIGEGLHEWEEIQNLMFIEGIGCNFGYSHTYSQGLLSCVHKNGVLAYESNYGPLADLCDLETLSSTNEEFTNTSLYPNPTNTTFQINYPQELGKSDLKIYNLQGKLMHHEANYQQQEINVQDLAVGIYFVELRGENGQQWNKKLIKN